MGMTPDIEELAAQAALYDKIIAASAMPPLIQLEVWDSTPATSSGYAWCTLEGRRVRCDIPMGIDLSAATQTNKYVLWALPKSGKAKNTDYVAIALAWNGDSGSRLANLLAYDRIRLTVSRTPASAAATGTTGEICWDSSYIYVCVATNTWKRVAISTW